VKARRLVLFTGMGADPRLLETVKVEGAEVLAPRHLEPEPGERLESYAERAAERHRIAQDDVVGGTSFGGMIAAQIAKRRRVAGLVLLGSCVRPSKLPASYVWAEKAGKLIPDWAFAARSWRPILRWRFAPLTPEAEACILAMAKDYPVKRLRDFGRMVVGWPGVQKLDCPLLSIHGDRDRIIPLRSAEPGLVLENAGHAFTLTHAAAMNAAVRSFLVQNRLLV
jgi:pimeloyl-ACP methyl ester carboxylesterase